MPATFNLTEEALRKAFAVYVDVSEQSGTWSAASAEWEVQGFKTEDTALEFNPDTETITDILGDTYTTVNKLERAMSFEPNTIRPIANRGKLNEILHEMTRRGELSRMSQFKVMLAYAYVGTADTGPFAADVYPSCTVTPQSLGGSSRTDFPYDINFGGEPMFGTVDKLAPGLVFTAEV